MRLKWFMALLIVVSSLSATTATQENVTKLYVATFDRAPDKDGLNYWLNSGFDLESIAMSFFDQKETAEKYPTGTTIGDFISAVYFNLFDRSPDAKGEEYWANALYNGDITAPLFILATINGATGDDATLLANKTQVGLAYAQTSSQDIQTANDVIANITTDDTTVEAALTEIENLGGSSSDTNPSSDTTLPANAQAVVDYHNAVRAELYSGSQMTWSQDLANESQAYAETLAQIGELQHDYASPYGENLAASSARISFAYAAELWYGEKPNYDYASNSCVTGTMCGHYTQMIWKNSTEVGCGSAVAQVGRFAGGDIVVCRYNPAGNYTGQQPY